MAAPDLDAQRDVVVARSEEAFFSQRERLLKELPGRFVAYYDGQLLGDFSTFTKAHRFAVDRLGRRVEKVFIAQLTDLQPSVRTIGSLDSWEEARRACL